MQIKIKKLNPDAVIPNYIHEGDAGLNVYTMEEGIIGPGQRWLFPLGFAMEFPSGYVALMKDRSSMAKNGLHCLGGVFDAGYRGEYNVLLVNLSDQPYHVQRGDKIAQLVVQPVTIAEIVETTELSDSARGTGGFGSTGK